MPTFIVTTCLSNCRSFTNPDYKKREKEYSESIEALIRYTKEIPNIRIIIVEGNGPRKTILDRFGVEVVYTYNNKFNIKNYGTKEFLDVQQTIYQCNIPDDEMVVKMTGRYLLKEESPFLKTLMYMASQPDEGNIDCLIKYGNMDRPVLDTQDCITGLIGIRCKYLKRLDISRVDSNNSPIEWYWARLTHLIPKERIVSFNGSYLGITVRPSGWHKLKTKSKLL
jgi:hypothetical protein